jgi:uncharacterized membrane protein
MVDFYRAFGTHYRQINLLASLMLTTALCVALLFVRMFYSQTTTYFWMLWNLFLALIPAFSSLIAFNLNQKNSRLNWLLVISWAGIWLVFFPNSLYLVTDIIHLRLRDNIPLWYDLVMMVAFAWAGCLLGLVSLSLMQNMVSKVVGKRGGWLFALGVLCLSGFGIYLGRFLRWNSWDVLTSPMSLTLNIYGMMKNPFILMQATVFSGLFAVLFTTIYLTLVAFTQFEPGDSQFKD